MERDEHESWLANTSLEDMRRIVDALYGVHTLVEDITDLDTLLESIMEMSKEVAQAEACSLMLYDEESDELYFHVALGQSGDQQALKQNLRLKLDQGVAGLAATTREAVHVRDAKNDSRIHREADEIAHFETRSLLAVPLVDRGNLVGVLEVVNKLSGKPFTDTDQRVIEMFSSRVAAILLSARLIEENVRSERLAAIGQAVAGLSHYTKNILTGMSGSVEIIDLGLARGKIDLLQRGWNVFKRSVARLSGVVEDMLTYSKPRKLSIEPCDLKELISDVMLTYTNVLQRQEADVSVDTEGIAGPVYVDGRSLYRSILNLISNASDAIPKTGGKIVVRARLLDSGPLEIVVSDNGPGIPEDKIENIFDPFYSTKGSSGTGLGLAVTLKVILEHGGRLDVERGPEGGALFRIVLPQDKQRPEMAVGD